MYGAQAGSIKIVSDSKFENDVEMYGAQAGILSVGTHHMFENDVEMYGAQAFPPALP